jgi:predicted metal-dependent peptidase
VSNQDEERDLVDNGGGETRSRPVCDYVIRSRDECCLWLECGKRSTIPLAGSRVLLQVEREERYDDRGLS